MLPSEFLARVSSAELVVLLADVLLEPRGEEREDWRAAMLASTTARTWGAKVSIRDFLLEFDSEKIEQQKREEAMKRAVIAASYARRAAKRAKEDSGK